MHPKYWKFPGAAYREQASDGATGSAGGGAVTGPLDANTAASAFEARLSDEPPAEQKPAEQQAAAQQQAAQAEETEDQAAERLAREQANPDDEVTTKPETFTVKVDGKDMTLTAEEMAEHVKAGMRDKDYRQKTMEVADVRKTAEAEIAKARDQRDQYAAKLQQAAGLANYELQTLSAQLTEELLQTDPVEYLRVKSIAEQRQAQLAQAHQELQQITQQRAQEKAEADRHHAAHQQEQLLAKVPEWKDQAKAKAEVAQLKDYLATQGYEAGEADFTDHRSIVLARKAMQFDALMTKAREATKKIAGVPPKVERPGNAETGPKPGDGRTAAMKQLKETGTVDAAAGAFSQFL